MEKSNKKSQGHLKSNNRLVALAGVFIAISLVLSYLESLIPVFIAVPGVKLGIANIVTMFTLYKLGLAPAVTVSAGRILLSGILFGNLTLMLYSFAGAFLSIFFMVLIKRTKLFSVVGVSVVGGVAHNLGQIIVASIIMENAGIMYYMPVLIISGCVAGTVVGIITSYVIKNTRV